MGQAGLISVAKYDGHIISYGYKEGFEDIKQIRPISGKYFNIASLSKQFTAFAILTLEEQRKISLSDSVLKYLPELGEYARDITLQHLIYHTSGLKDYLELALNRGVSYTDDLSVEGILEDIYRQSRYKRV
ncbi:serine hydrolase domain-containing protein [Acinetobacter nectaris]|uniref:serine hydrolase domain-containing protein n=1 Tax=Acinetobacter nectaris TaxID=1219382 RepID=UPI001F47CFDF|nr:serine hydrolase domain-containing protein [Acinetobacter nectaris]MCF8998133.1 beta-lactamase family protein [Acinetobacter nectaris]MCF9026941.1 beta-lactamase family protein [Acinetobacter nectaris]